jgi:hypothetical protein
MKIVIFTVLLFILHVFNAPAQTYNLRGTVYDISSNTPLEFVTVKLEGASSGTTADNNGEYIIKLPDGLHKLIFSYIGYNSDTITVNIDGKDEERDVFLKPTAITTEEIVVTGEDPAYEIIRKAIRYKKEFQKNLNQYEYEAYSKLVLRSNAGSVDPVKTYKDSADTDKLGIMGILESETKGYFKKPDLYKEIVKSKRETANINRGVALPYVVNFYDEDVDLQQIKIPGPLADDALDHYDYRLTGTSAIDSMVIYKIEVINQSNLVPQFYGTIYIADSIFALMKVDLYTNDAGKIRFVDKANFKQKFTNYTSDKNYTFWMPTDVQIFAEGSFGGLIRFNGEVYTIISKYELNKKIPDSIFDKYIIQVLPDAEKDSSYWAKNQLIKNTYEEQKAYNEIEAETEKKKNQVRLGLTTINYGQNFSSSPLSFYRFNRVEGSHLQFNLNYRNQTWRDVASGYIGYGFSDKKTKYSLRYSKRLLSDRSLRVTASIFRELTPLSFDLFGLAEFYNTAEALLDKKDEFDYSYRSGYSINIANSSFPQLRFNFSFRQEKQWSAVKNTDYSFRKKEQPFDENPAINDAFMRRAGLSVTYDPNEYKFIDWGDGEESRIRMTNYPSLELEYFHSPKSLGSTYEFRTFGANISGRNYVNALLNFRYRAAAYLMTGTVPFQNLLYFNANTGGLDFPLGFKTMQYQEYLGDKQFYLTLENNFGKLLWGNIPYINKWNLILFYSAGRMDIRDENYNLAAYKFFSGTKGLYQEAGFGISGILDILRIDFAWRLNNYRDGRNFNFMLSLDNF